MSIYPMLKYRDLDDIEDVVDLCQLKNACLCVCVCVLYARCSHVYMRVHACVHDAVKLSLLLVSASNAVL